MLTVKILGSGCANCRKLEAVARDAAARADVQAEFVKVTDMKAILAYDLMSTPGLVVNESDLASMRENGRLFVTMSLTLAFVNP